MNAATPSPLRPRPGIMEIAPYVGGESGIAGHNRVLKLSSNESALGPSPRAMVAYRALAGELHRYPDGNATQIREALARHHGLNAARILCGAGSDELISLLVRAYAGPGDEVLYSQYGFLMYAISAKSVGAIPVAAPEGPDLIADIDALLAHVSPRTRLLFLANPNNPTGSFLAKSEVARLRRALREDVLLVLDSAYAEYVDRPDYDPGNELADAYDNVVMLRTFSKIYGLAGLRIGWGYGSPAVIDVLNRVRGPFNTAAAAQAAAVAALEDKAHLAAAKAHNAKWLAWTRAKLEALGFKTYPSLGNFLLVRFADADAAAAALQAGGVIPRKMAGYGLPDCLRITIGTGEEMETAVAQLTDFAGRGGPR